MKHVIAFLQREEAATAVEYAVMLALILVGIVGTIGAVGAQAGGLWSGIEGDLESHGFGS